MSNTEKQPLEALTLNNDHLEVHVSKFPHCLVKLTINASPAAVKASYQKALKNIKKEISIPGFRKGKAPDKFVLEHYKSHINDEWKQVVIRTAINEAIQLTKLYPLGEKITHPIDVKECDMEKGAIVECQYETYADIPAIDLQTIELPAVPHLNITEDQINSRLHDYAFSNATFEPVEGRGVEENDVVNLSLTLLQEPPVELVKQQEVEITPTKVPLWVYEKIIGLKASESAEGVTRLETAFEAPNDNFTPTPFRVTIHSIQKAQLPEIDDELAKKMGTDSLEQLKEGIKKNLEHQAQFNRQHILEKHLLDFLSQNYVFEIPESLYKERVQELINSRKNELKKTDGTDSDAILKEFEEAIRKKFIREYRLFILLKKCGEDNEIEADEADLTEEIHLQLKLAQSEQSSIDFSQPKDELFEELKFKALERKTKKFLIDHAKTS